MSINISNLKIKQISSGLKFSSQEDPFVYAGACKTKGSSNATKITVFAPFHSNAFLCRDMNVKVSIQKSVNWITFTPTYDKTIPLSNIYTQVAKISFTLNGATIGTEKIGTDKYKCAIVRIVINEEGLPDLPPGKLGEPLRKTKIIVQTTNA